jgi:microcystin-dependent protein
MAGFRYPYDVRVALEGWRDKLGERYEDVLVKLFDRDRALENTLTEADPVAKVIAWAGGSTAPIPKGWLLCDGSAVLRTQFPALFNTIGITYGAGDGSTTFNVPNLKLGRVPAGQDASLTDFTTLGQTGGSIGSNMPTHSHTLSATGGTGAETGHNHSHDHGLTNHNHGGGTGVHAHTVSGCVQTSTSGHLHDNTGQQFASRPTGAISFMNAGDPPTNSVGVANSPQGGNDTSGSSGHTHSLTGSTDATTGVNNNLPPYIVMRYLIRV